MSDTPAKVYVYVILRYVLTGGFVFSMFTGHAQVQLDIRGVDRDSASIAREFNFKRSFPGPAQLMDYVNQLPSILRQQGYPAASVDSIFSDSTRVRIHLYVGEAYAWGDLNTDSVDQLLLQEAGWPKPGGAGNVLKLTRYSTLRENMLSYLENNGYPFASVKIDSLQIRENLMYGRLRIEKGPLYQIDSVRNLGSARISPSFLQRYLGLLPGSIYKKNTLGDVSARLRELPYVTEAKPWDMTLLSNGSVVNVYLEPKKSSQVNVLIGLLPSNQQLGNSKMLVTGEANINLRNSLGSGETLGLNWQQIQPRSPRLDLLYIQPYLFKSPFGLNFNFDLFKKDSSFITVSMIAGARYALSARQSGNLFIQNFSSSLLDVDTQAVKTSRRLPEQADIRSVNIGVEYTLNTTDYRFNPRKGNELSFSLSAGTRTIRKNNVIVRLYDPFQPDFDFNRLYDTLKLKSTQFQLRLDGAHYFPLSRVSTFKVSLRGGWIRNEQLLRNELFQIGGYKLLRGFDEESIFASAYAVSSAEYRYFIGLNSYLFAFTDFGWVENASVDIRQQFLGAGLGLAFETRAGIFNMSWAAGKRSDSPFNLRQSKIHLGYINYF